MCSRDGRVNNVHRQSHPSPQRLQIVLESDSRRLERDPTSTEKKRLNDSVGPGVLLWWGRCRISALVEANLCLRRMGATHLLGQDQGACSYLGNSKTFRLFHIIFIVFVECYDGVNFLSNLLSGCPLISCMVLTAWMSLLTAEPTFRVFLRKIWWREMLLGLVCLRPVWFILRLEDCSRF